MEQKELKFIDVARGIGIILVVLGHAITKDFVTQATIYYILRNLIYTIHMPLFFAISGLLYEKNKLKYFKISKSYYIKSKFFKFMIPYFSFSVIVYLIVYISSKINLISDILTAQGFIISNLPNTIISILTYINHIDNHLWFLYVMFLILCINRVFIKEVNKKNVIILLLLYIFSYLISIYIPEIIWKTLRYLFIFQFGRILYYKNNEKNTKAHSLLSTFTFMISFVALLLCKINNYQLLLPIVSLLVELSSAYIILFLISKKIQNNKFLQKLGNGEISMAIYMLHMPFILTVILYILIKLHCLPVIAIALTTIITILICIFLYKFILSRIPIIRKLIFGNTK